MLDDKRKGTPVSSDEKDKLADLLSFCGADPAIMGDLMDKSEVNTYIIDYQGKSVNYCRLDSKFIIIKRKNVCLFETIAIGQFGTPFIKL